ncbi:unnamed protein product [Gongylonema pulchrum]|uniref:Ovule protein n=1 Tax=Gongylonema pulchrum TaxID=637853 RepID=A0A183D122_9BILA|nr:unnamed protein product [Gongylonema pulchrum]
MENEKDAAQKLLGDLQQPISGNSRLGNISDHYVTEEKLENVVDSEPDPATSLAIDTEADAKTVLAKSVKKHEDDSNSIPQQIFGFEGSTATYGNEAPNSPCGFDDHADQELGLTPGSKAAIAAQSHGAPNQNFVKSHKLKPITHIKRLKEEVKLWHSCMKTPVLANVELKYCMSIRLMKN